MTVAKLSLRCYLLWLLLAAAAMIFSVVAGAHLALPHHEPLWFLK